MKTIAVINRQVGVGKTTTTVNIAAILADKYKAKVLVVDMAPLFCASTYLGVHTDPEIHSYHVLCHKASIEDAIYHTQNFCGIDLVPSGLDSDLTECELLKHHPESQFVLKERLLSVADKYDYCLIDCPPSRNILTINALTAAQYAIIPFEATPAGIKPIDRMDVFVNDIICGLNSDLKNTGFLFIRKRNPLFPKDYSDEIIQTKSYKFYKHEIRESVAVNDAAEHNLPLILFCPNEPVTQDYLAVTEELLEQMK